MRALLAKWSILEPPRCAFEGDLPGRVMLRNAWRHVPFVRGMDEALELATIQAAVQEAIKARGWGYHLTNVFVPSSDTPDITGAFDVIIYVSDDGDYASMRQYGDGRTEAEALLSTYLLALEYVDSDPKDTDDSELLPF